MGVGVLLMTCGHEEKWDRDFEPRSDVFTRFTDGSRVYQSRWACGNCREDIWEAHIKYVELARFMETAHLVSHVHDPRTASQVDLTDPNEPMSHNMILMDDELWELRQKRNALMDAAKMSRDAWHLYVKTQSLIDPRVKHWTTEPEQPRDEHRLLPEYSEGTEEYLLSNRVIPGAVNRANTHTGKVPKVSQGKPEIQPGPSNLPLSQRGVIHASSPPQEVIDAYLSPAQLPVEERNSTPIPFDLSTLAGGPDPDAATPTYLSFPPFTPNAPRGEKFKDVDDKPIPLKLLPAVPESGEDKGKSTDPYFYKHTKSPYFT